MTQFTLDIKMMYNSFTPLTQGDFILATLEKTKPVKLKREKSTSTKGHYVTNAVLLPAVIEAKALGKVTDKLIRMIQMIAERYSWKVNFNKYTYREDMVNSAVMNLCNNALKFNLEKSSNPFSFYTTAIHNSFLQFIADEKKQRNIKDALLIDAGANPSFNFMQGEKDEQHFEIKESDELYVNPKNLDSDEDTHRTDAPREAKIGYLGRVPGPVKRYGPKDIIVDPETGAITFKEPVAKIKKAAVAKVKKEAPVAKKVVAKKTEKAKPVVKATSKKAVAMKAVKKTASSKKV